MKKIYFSFVGLVLCALTNSASAQNLFLKADGITDRIGIMRGFEDYAEITSMQFGITSEASFQGGPEVSLGRPNFNQIVITKNVDAASSKLMDRIAKGEVLRNVMIVSTASMDAAQKVMHKVELKDVYLTEIAMSSVQGCEGGCPAIAESYKLIYKAIRITTYRMDPKGAVVANPPFEYNVVEQTSSF